VIHGASDRWVTSIFMIAWENLEMPNLLGKDTWETEDAIKKELGYNERG